MREPSDYTAMSCILFHFQKPSQCHLLKCGRVRMTGHVIRQIRQTVTNILIKIRPLSSYGAILILVLIHASITSRNKTNA